MEARASRLTDLDDDTIGIIAAQSWDSTVAGGLLGTCTRCGRMPLDSCRHCVGCLTLSDPTLREGDTPRCQSP